MGSKNQFPTTFNWQASNPVTGFLPNPRPGGSAPSGTIAGAMASTNTIYSNILVISKMDNVGLEVTWTGTPTGVLSVLGSNSGLVFYPFTFSPALTQPAGSAGGYIVSMTNFSFKYILLQYVNASGTGSLSVYGQMKDVN